MQSCFENPQDLEHKMKEILFYIYIKAGWESGLTIQREKYKAYFTLKKKSYTDNGETNTCKSSY